MTGVRLQDLVARQRRRDLVGQALEAFNHAGFPVDQRAVAVERQGFVVMQPHRGSP